MHCFVMRGRVISLAVSLIFWFKCNILFVSGQNVAVQRTTCQSANTYYTCSSKNAVDGIDGCYCDNCNYFGTYCVYVSATDRQLIPWWAIDFESPLSISKVEITTAGKCYSSKKFVLHPSPIMMIQFFFATLFNYDTLIIYLLFCS